MIEPNDESYQPGRELGPEEQKWLRNERDEQEWLREQQDIFPQQVSNIAAAPATWRLREAPEEEHGLSEVYASGAGVRSEGKQLQRSSFFCLLPGQHRACAKKKVDMERARNDLEEHQLKCAWRDSDIRE